MNDSRQNKHSIQGFENRKIVRLKDVGSLQNGISKGKDYFGFGFPFVSYGNIYNDTIELEQISTLANSTLEDQKQYSVLEGDVFFTRTSETIDEIGISATALQTIPKATFSGFVIRLRPTKRLIKKEYSKYFFKADLNRQFLSGQISLVTRASLNQNTLSNLPVILPSMEEQTAIANYLDTKTQAIDKKLSLLQKKIGYYQELRKSLINVTVTKGLDKKVKFKDSGIDWIGQIPEHWEIVRIKDFTYVKARIGWQGLRSDEFELAGDYYCVTGTDFIEGSIDWSNCYHVEKERYIQDRKIILRIGDLLITKDGSIGKTAIVNNLPKPATLNSGVFVTRPRQGKYLNRYMYWLLNSKVFLDFIDFAKNGTTILHLYQNVFENFFYCLPPLLEQEEISNFLESKTIKIDHIITNLQTQITFLKELRKTLINDAITGKIKVIND